MSNYTKTNPYYKYNIYDRLQNLTKSDYNKALIELPQILSLSKRQFLLAVMLLYYLRAYQLVSVYLSL